MKKLIPALCLLLVSAVLLGTSSYAWFSMNSQVKATGMQIEVVVPSSMTISVTSATAGFSEHVLLVNDSTTSDTIRPSIYATSANVTKERDFFILSDAAMATVNENGVLGTIIGSSDSSSTIADNDYYDATTADYFKDTMWLRYDAEADAVLPLQVKVEWDNIDVSTDIKNAFHILFIDENGAVLTDYDMSNAGNGQKLNISLTSGATAGTKITAYGYLSGNDPQCKNSAITVDSTLKVKITFTEYVEPTA